MVSLPAIRALGAGRKWSVNFKEDFVFESVNFFQAESVDRVVRISPASDYITVR